MVLFSLKCIITLWGYHVFKETAWSDAKNDDVDLETDQSSLANYAYAWAKKHEYFGPSMNILLDGK